jgi:hypothetical protein
MRRRAFALLVISACATTGSGDRDAEATRELTAIASFRASHHDEAALAGLDRLLKRLAASGGAATLSPATRASLDAELAAARTFVGGIGTKDGDAGRPLSAEAALARLAPLLTHAELADAAALAARRARESGRATCARLQASVAPETPYWGLVVRRTCEHFGVAYESPPLVSGISKLELDGAVVGLTPEQVERLRARVAGWVKSSLWYEPTGQATARGTVHGKVEVSFQHRAVTRNVSYQDTIVTSTSGVGHSFGKPGPIFVRGTGVTKLDRMFTYDAEEHRGHYGMTAKVSLEVGASEPLKFTLQRVENLTAYEHDTTFPKAGIQPSHENVPTADEWLAYQLDRMSARAVLHLNHKFVTLHCRGETASLEAAARCALADQQPTPVRATLSEALGEDAQLLGPLLRRQAPPKPRKPEKAPAGASDGDDNPVFD